MSAGRDILVVGGGPWGLAIAWRAARRGATVGLIDDGGLPAAHAAAGMLGPWSEALAHEEADFVLHRAALDAWPAFVDDLAADGGVPVLYERCGTLFVAARPDEPAEVRRRADLLAGLGEVARWSTGSTLRASEGALGPRVAGGVELADEAQVDPRRVLKALRSCAAQRGVERIQGRAIGLHDEGGTIRGVALDDGRVLRSGRVVLAAGWAAGLVDHAVPLRPVRGQTLHLRWAEGEIRPLERVVRTPSVYVVPRSDHRIVVGATAEEGRDLTARSDGVHRLLDDAFEVLPALRESVFDEVAVGVRPATPDGRPAVGPGHRDGLVWAVGGYRHGMLLTPWAADAALDQIAGSAAAEHCDPRRFAAREPACA
ncbi:MAG: glycine oxidase ThiO [Miltoncostaeaceae bacterium]